MTAQHGLDLSEVNGQLWKRRGCSFDMGWHTDTHLLACRGMLGCRDGYAADHSPQPLKRPRKRVLRTRNQTERIDDGGDKLAGWGAGL